MKTRATLAAAALFLSAHAFAAVGVAIGHHTWAEDGIPAIGPNEQVAVFTCTGKMNGPSAMSCAVEKCLAHFKLPKNAEITRIAETVLVGGKCSPESRSDNRGHSLVVAGPRGDNRFIFTRALGYATREEAEALVRSDGFPLAQGTIILDYFDKDGTLPPSPAVLTGPGGAKEAYQAFFHAVTAKRDPLALERARVAINIAKGDNAFFESCLAGNSHLISCVQGSIARSRSDYAAATLHGYHLAAATDPYRFTENPREAAKAFNAISKRLGLDPKAPDYVKWPGEDDSVTREYVSIALRSWIMDACMTLAMPHSNPKAPRPVVFDLSIQSGSRGQALCIAVAARETARVLNLALGAKSADLTDGMMLLEAYDSVAGLAEEYEQEVERQSRER